MTLREGDIITVIKEDPSGWWKGELNGKVGLFPFNFCQEMSGESTQSNETQKESEQETQTQQETTHHEEETMHVDRVAIVPTGALDELKKKMGSHQPKVPIDEQLKKKNEGPTQMDFRSQV